MDFNSLRNKYSSFVYKDYTIDLTEEGYVLEYHFEITGLDTFKTKWIFPKGKRNIRPDDIILNEMAFNLGMVEAISYYKISCPKTVKIECGLMNEKKDKWWKKLFYNGLGEFMYRNGIDVSSDELFDFEYEDSPEIRFDDSSSYEGYMVPVGGGKDSVVSLELLSDDNITTYCVNKSDTVKNVIERCTHAKADIAPKRILDKKVLEYNEKGYLNGHIPFSAVLAFSSYIAAFLNGIKYIALSNENSANETTVKGSFVNHQYSKSYEFEEDFRSYVSSYFASDIQYFSALRPLNESLIAMLFASHKQYHDVFRSCNAGSKKGIWCCNCPKCLFVYIILSPYLNDDELIKIFGENLLDKPSLEKDFRELTGIDENKPFECVGTRSEVNASLKEYIKTGRRGVLTDKYKEKILSSDDGYDLKKILNEWCDKNALPEEVEEKLRFAVESNKKLWEGKV